MIVIGAGYVGRTATRNLTMDGALTHLLEA